MESAVIVAALAKVIVVPDNCTDPVTLIGFPKNIALPSTVMASECTAPSIATDIGRTELVPIFNEARR